VVPRAAFQDRYQLPWGIPAYHMARKRSSTRPRDEKAQVPQRQRASQEQIIAAFENLTFEAPSGRVQMTLGKGHQAVQGTAYGTTRLVKGQLTLSNIKAYPADKVNPPEGVKSEEWIKSGFKAK
jgi:branched-chain amino acid transport system substrate-binding protein